MDQPQFCQVIYYFDSPYLEENINYLIVSILQGMFLLDQVANHSNLILVYLERCLYH